MKLHTMNLAETRTERNRVGRGPGSGNGKTSGRGVILLHQDLIISDMHHTQMQAYSKIPPVQSFLYQKAMILSLF